MILLSSQNPDAPSDVIPRFLAPAPSMGTTGVEPAERTRRITLTLDLLEAWAWASEKSRTVEHALIVVSDPRWLGHPLLDDFRVLAERASLRQNTTTIYSGAYGSSSKSSASQVALSYTQPRPQNATQAPTGEILLSSPAMAYSLSRMRAMLELYGRSKPK